MERMSTVKLQIAERARRHSSSALHNLHGFMDEVLLEEVYKSTNKKSSSGVDGQTWTSYGKDLKPKLNRLLEQFRKGNYKAPHVRRVFIKKDNGKLRPLGIPTIEDKVLQGGVKSVIEPIYERIFKQFSFGFRTNHSAHQAIEYLSKEVRDKGIRYIIDADIENYFGTINHSHLRSFLDRRVKDGVIRRMINKWLKAGILEEKQLSYPKEGTPQGGVISPLLSNIYLHYVLDEWFEEEIQPLLSGQSMIVRYADDFILGFKNLKDMQRVLAVLTKRFGKYDLKLSAEKTKVVDLQSKRGEGARSFDFLSFTHYLGKSRKGNKVLKRKTKKSKLSKSIKKLSLWIRNQRHMKLTNLIEGLNKRLRGHYNYYGIMFNTKGIKSFFSQIKRSLFKWLNRRGGKRKNWEHFTKIIEKWQPLVQPRIRHHPL